MTTQAAIVSHIDHQGQIVYSHAHGQSCTRVVVHLLLWGGGRCIWMNTMYMNTMCMYIVYCMCIVCMQIVCILYVCILQVCCIMKQACVFIHAHIHKHGFPTYKQQSTYTQPPPPITHQSHAHTQPPPPVTHHPQSHLPSTQHNIATPMHHTPGQHQPGHPSSA